MVAGSSPAVLTLSNMVDPTTAQEQWELGKKYYHGDDGKVNWSDEFKPKKDQAEAVRLYRLAAEQGHLMACHNLGLAYEFGEGVEKDQAEAEKWYAKAKEIHQQTWVETNVPTRICCGQRHEGVVCPDGKVMCCLCFKRVTQDLLSTYDGQKTDVCKKCDNAEIKSMKQIIATGNRPDGRGKLDKAQLKRIAGTLAERIQKKRKTWLKTPQQLKSNTTSV